MDVDVVDVDVGTASPAFGRGGCSCVICMSLAYHTRLCELDSDLPSFSRTWR